MEFELQCERCGACCRHPGEVRLEPEEVASIAAFLALKEEEFIEAHTRLRKDRRGLALNEQGDHSCIFLAGNSCVIQKVKPRQCREFPNRWVNLLWGKVPLAAMQRDYPMLLGCSAFKTFLNSRKSPPD